MTRIRTQLATVVVALLLVASAVPFSADTATAAQHSFVVEQGDRCFEVTPLQGDQDVKSFYDYRHPNNSDSYTYSSYMPAHLPREDASRLFLYEGSDGVSLVMVHNERDGTGGGHAVSFDFQGLPGEGEWAVMDDDYGGQDDRFSRDSIDWTFRSDRTDGGAFRGLDRSGTAITVTARFNEDAEFYDDFNRSDRIESWQFLSGNLDSPDATVLQTSQAVTIRTGSCTDETPPNAALSAEGGVAGFPTTLDASNSTDGETGIAEYRWDFDGDGEVDRSTDGPRTDYIYNETGEYRPRVTVVDGGGNGDAANATLTVEADDPPTPELEVSADQPAEGAEVGFDASNSTDDTGIAEYRWTFGDGENSTGETVTHSYDGNGSYTVTLHVVDEGGNEATEQVDLAVRPSDDTPPEVAASATPAEVEAGANVTFDASDSADDGTGIAEYRWEFGDGTIATGENATHAYGAAGTYDATVTVTDESGNANSTDVAVEVLPAGDPTANLSVSNNETEVGKEVTFDASDSADDVTGIAEYRWDFDGNGTDETTEDPTISYEYDEVGNVTATVTVADRAGNTDTAAVEMVVAENQKPIDDGDDGGDDAGTSDGGDSGGSAGGSSGGGGASSTAPPPIVTQTERLGPNEAAVDVQNGRTGETIRGELPESDVAGETGVRFTEVGVNLASDDAHFVIETARAAEGADEVPADVSLGSLAVGTKYLDGETVENATYEVAVERSRLDEAGLAPDDLAVYQRTDGEWTRVDATVEERDGRVVLRAHADALGDIAVGADRSLTVADAALAEEEVAASDPVEVTATVRNEKSDRAEFGVDLTADGDVVATKTVEIAGGETAEVAFERRLDAGAHEVAVEGRSVGSVTVANPAADIAVADVSLNASTIAPGERVEITATVENAGAKAGEHDVALTLFGERLENRTVELGPGETTEVTFVRQISAAGTYTAEVGDQSAELSVSDSQTSDDGSPAPSAPVPGFGVGTAVVALLAAALLARVRRSDES